MEIASEDWDWSAVPDESVKEMLRLAELQLDDTIRFALAADQRAATLCSVFGAVSAGLFAADATILTISEARPMVVLALAVMAAGILLASLTCGAGGRPRPFHTRGYDPQCLIGSAADPIWLMRFSVQDLHRRLETNREALEGIARTTLGGFRVAVGSIGVGVLCYAVGLVLGG